MIAATDLELEPLLDRLESTADATAHSAPGPANAWGAAREGTLGSSRVPHSAPGPANAWGAAREGTLGSSHVVVQALGLGKANTAAGLVAALLTWRPRAVVQLGIGGAYLGSFLSVGMVAVATEEVDLDLGVGRGDGWRGLEAIGFPLTPAVDTRPERRNVVPTHAPLTAAFRVVAEAAPVRFATSDTLTGDVDAGAALAREHDVAVESMEGVAAAQVCDRLGTPFAEVRGISNIVGERDRRRWNLRAGTHGACDVVRALLRDARALDEALAER